MLINITVSLTDTNNKIIHSAETYKQTNAIFPTKFHIYINFIKNISHSTETVWRLLEPLEYLTVKAPTPTRKKWYYILSKIISHVNNNTYKFFNLQVCKSSHIFSETFRNLYQSFVRNWCECFSHCLGYVMEKSAITNQYNTSIDCSSIKLNSTTYLHFLTTFTNF